MGNELFGYYECKKGIEYSSKAQVESEVVHKWNEYMKDIMIMKLDSITGEQPQLIKVFELD